ncbi:hypothetical protein MLD38_035487 [Melastoma candidum]|uniref:Uncharacterized protein n=1 Tax=Melastoma candidum TaxID=119954 RepID=A0ACB9LH20_9MYRT|nr:hypothetical protein MLD38_035487 [Melastoma candidum]
MRNAAKLLSETFPSNRHSPSSSSPSCYSSTALSRNPTASLAMDPLPRYCFNPKLTWNPEVKDYFVAAYGEARISVGLTSSIFRLRCCNWPSTKLHTSKKIVSKKTEESKVRFIELV